MDIFTVILETSVWGNDHDFVILKSFTSLKKAEKFVEDFMPSLDWDICTGTEEFISKCYVREEEEIWKYIFIRSNILD